MRHLDIEIRVKGGKCQLLRPRWMLQAEARTATGEGFLDEIGTRFAVLESVAGWLERNRQEFLRTPEPAQLGVDALEEMNAGLPSVSPGAFLRLSGIENGINRLANPKGKTSQSIRSLFSRFTNGCYLSWDSGSVPLEFLFGIEARNAWVASAVLQFCAATGNPLTKERLVKYSKITVPKGTGALVELRTMKLNSLGIADFIRRANAMVETRWSEVVASHLEKMVL